MGSYSTTHSSLAERVRAAVATFRAAEGNPARVYVLLECADFADPLTGKARGTKRIVARRIYDGEHKSLEGRQTIIVGLDLGEQVPAPVAIPVAHHTYEVTVRGTSWAGADTPFEGVLELKSIPLER